MGNKGTFHSLPALFELKPTISLLLSTVFTGSRQPQNRPGHSRSSSYLKESQIKMKTEKNPTMVLQTVV